ncbi:MAG: hypothetical protein ACRD9S_23575, partial [Pyrinomonadaceae bacterium]
SPFAKRKAVATPSELRQNKDASYPRVAKRNPGLELANAFSVNLKLPVDLEFLGCKNSLPNRSPGEFC